MIMDGMTSHAQRRLQQRGIPPFVLHLLERFGSIMRCGGAERLFFDKAAMNRLRQELGGERGLRTIERWLGVYAVIGDNGQFVTVAHKHRRFRRQ
jgi:hypothetical protein